MTLADFLLARIAEDEEGARDAALTVGWDGFGEQRIRSGQRWNPSYHVVKRARDDGPADRREVADCGALFGISTANHIARHDPARVLAECEAKRQIVAEHGPETVDEGWDRTVTYCKVCRYDDGLDRDVHPCRTLSLLALPYADHPDYDQSWRP